MSLPDPIPKTIMINYLPIAALKPNERNARTHTKKQIRQIADSIRVFGFNNPALIDKDGVIIAGHGRTAAALLLGLKEVPTICLDHLTQEQVRAFMIADNQLALNAGWDEAMLAIEFQSLTILDLDYSLSITGFDLPQIDYMIQSLNKAEPDEEEIPEVHTHAVTKLGDIWQLGDHRIICGDSLSPETYAALMEVTQAQMVFTDPPYNVSIDGNVCGLGKVRHKEFAMASGEMSMSEFTQFLGTTSARLVENTVSGSLHFICMDWRHMRELLDATAPHYAELKNLCVWNKDNGGMGSLYRSKHELVFVFKYGGDPHINNIALGKHGRYRTNVWDYAGQNSLRGRDDGLLNAHPTVKPVAMVADAILDCSHRKGIVLDPFGGSGTTLIAAEQTGRRARLIELEPRYVDVTIRRWQQMTEKAAVLISTGQSFEQLEIERSAMKLKEITHV